MKNKLTRTIAFIVALTFMSFGVITANAETSENVNQKIDETTEYLLQLSSPSVSSIGGDWIVIGLSRAGHISSDFENDYYKNVEEYIAQIGSSKLSSSKSTENSRVITALSSIGKDAQNVAGYNLLEPLSDFNYIKKQGINGPIWALIALDTAKYNIPENDDAETQTTREVLIEYILNAQLQDGGWALTGTTVDPDITGMAIQALAPYYNFSQDIKSSVDNALDILSSIQQDDGGFTSWGTENSESCAQVITALTSLGINPDTDSRFIKSGCSLVDALMAYSVENGFSHTLDGSYNQMATEQAYYALVSYLRLCQNKTSLYEMSDVNEIFPKDINGDGKTDVIDCTEIQKYLVDISDFTLTQLYYSDMNNDKSVSIADVTEYQRYIVNN